MTTGVPAATSAYAQLSREELIARLEALHPSIPPQPSSSTGTHNTLEDDRSGAAANGKRKAKPPKVLRPFAYHTHPTRHIALLVTYHGWPFSGLALQPPTSFAPDLQTVEGELLKALEKTRLIEEGKGWEGCEFSRCGRTDAGVSGWGQVVDLWVRSARRPGDGGEDIVEETWREASETAPPKPVREDEGGAEKGKWKKKENAPAEKKAYEIPYPRLLNGVLPPSIRVLGWAPVPSPTPTTPTQPFSSRFSCLSRHYKYAFHLVPSPSSPPLDLDRMRQAAAHLLGEHDFQNFCKLDGSKQLESHSRRVLDAWFDEEESGYAGMVVFNLKGTAFLWHQVRHIIAVLFLVGAGREEPSVVRELLDVERYKGKPIYAMGAALPLTLYEAEYEGEGLDWRGGGWDGPWRAIDDTMKRRISKEDGSTMESLEDALEAMRQEAEVRTWQISGALRKMRQVYGHSAREGTGEAVYPVGAGECVSTRVYRKLAERERGEPPSVVNQRWREGKGKRKAERREEDAVSA